MISFRACDRQELLHILGGGPPSARAFETVAGVRLAGSECGLLWRNEPEQLTGPPQVIVARDVEDFIAWASTYLATYRPITAYFRVVQEDDLTRFAARADDIASGELANAFAGAMLAETYLRSTRRSETWRPSILALLGTCSFVVARTFSLQSISAHRDVIIRWYRASRRVNGDDDGFMRKALESVWSDLAHVAGGLKEHSRHSIIVDACREVMRGGQIRPHTWSLLIGGSPAVTMAAEMMSLSRERRLEWLERVMRHLVSPEMSNAMTSFVIGYLFSQVAPGSLEHIYLLESLSMSHPEAVIWYGVCAGLHPRSDVQNYGNGIARRALRDVESWETLVDRPRCDFGVDELELLMPTFGTAIMQRPFIVEVAPRVYTTLGALPQRQQMIAEPIDRSRLLELGRLLSSATSLTYELTHPDEQRQIEFRQARQNRKAPPKGR